MFELSETQQTCLDLVRGAVAHSDFRAGLIYGNSGAGKRTIARHAAHLCGFKFAEVRLDRPALLINEQLFGTVTDSETARRSGNLPGLLGTSEPTLIYLSGLEQAQDDLAASLADILNRGAYVDAAGQRWTIDSNVWLVFGLVFPGISGARITPEHWLCTYMRWRVNVPAPSGHDICLVADEIAKGYSPGCQVSPDAHALLKMLAGSEANLHNVRRWIETAISRKGSSVPVTQASLRNVIDSDLRTILTRLRYRGEPIPEWHYEEWARQFPTALLPMCIQLVRKISEKYYLGDREFYDAIQYVLSRANIRVKSSVSFCTWQHMGKGSRRVAHVMKNAARWQVLSDVDLRRDETTWPDFGEAQPEFFILADDFVGSGDSMAKLFRKKPGRLKRLIERFPNAKIKILLLAGFDKGLSRVREAAIQAGMVDAIEIIASKIYSDEDRCFEAVSSIITDPAKRNELFDFCVLKGREHRMSAPAGYGRVGALVILHDTVPNNSLPILWHDAGAWHPLFPASRAISSYLLPVAENGGR